MRAHTNSVFDYRALRLLMGIIAFSFPFVVSIVSSTPLSSISASYHTEARDIFVGLLFIVSAFLWAYQGHRQIEANMSKVASVTAVLVALFPTACETCEPNIFSTIHYVAASILFSILAYFCLGPFRKNTKGQSGKKGRRAKIYFVCGWVIISCILTIGLSNLAFSSEMVKALHITYWGETIALFAFGIAWIVAGKVIKPLVDNDEALKLDQWLPIAVQKSNVA